MTGTQALALGLDAGGTQTRWAVVDAAGQVVASGAVAGFSALQLADGAGREAVAQVVAELARQVRACAVVQRAGAGVTGVGDSGEPAAQALAGLLAQALGLQTDQVYVGNDVEVAYRDVFAPGEGYLVYAGTGSIAVFIDADGSLHRAGGLGGVLDDAGSGFWIAREALRHIWRAEDERPGAWRDSPMAVRVFEHLGGSDWASTRHFVYAGTRGAMGELALAVAAAADQDAAARQILQQAGAELARLGRILLSRFGPRPLALGGRVSQLHPVVVESLRAALPIGQSLQVVSTQGHVAAARMAASGRSGE